MSASKPQESGEVRIGHSLNTNEEEFVARRRNTVLQCLQKFKIRCSQDAMPNIALLGSGGGQRAMVGLLGSLVQLDKEGLLDCILYLRCMASLYQEPDWSTKLETVKDKIVERLSGPGVRWTDALAKLKKYYYEKDIFSLTDLWAVMLVTTYVKEIDEQTLTDQRDQHNKDPYPIYAVIDKHSKQHEERDFEITPHEAGYSLTGAFVDTSSFGSRFKNKMKKQDEMDMLYLQAMCSSALADEAEIWKWLKALLLPEIKMASEKMRKGKDLTGGNPWPIFQQPKDPNSSSIDQRYQVLLDLVDMNLAVLKGADPSALDQSIRTTLTDMSGGQSPLIYQLEKLKHDKTADKKAAKQYMMQYTMDVCDYFTMELKLNSWPFDLLMSICRCIAQWIWGRKYNFLHDMPDGAVPRALLESETRDYIDAGLVLNSPYFSVLRKERDIDLIISLDFSDGDPFTDSYSSQVAISQLMHARSIGYTGTVTQTAETCKKLKIPFPEVNIANENMKKPKGFYVFKGQNAPTVIHIPLFNVANCGDKNDAWRKKYGTFQVPYSAEMITELMQVAGKNIAINRAKLLEQIRVIAAAKYSQTLWSFPPML